ncbi:hypothetical protein PC112_g25841, partial [Phytophthora cactorum]
MASSSQFSPVLAACPAKDRAEGASATSSGTFGLHSVSMSSSNRKIWKSLLPPVSPNDADKKCLVLDLDETLVHSSFRPTDNYDFIIPVNIDGTIHHVYVCKRPGAEEFLIEMAKYYEIVVYTASLSKYADPLLDKLDPEGVIRYRLYREHCV